MTVLGCTGHRRLPAALLGLVADGIRSEVDHHRSDALVGVSSLAVGADQLFAEAVIAAGGRLHAVIPSTGYEATFDPGERSTFRSLLARAHLVETLEFPRTSAAAFAAAGHRVVDLCDVLIAVWDGRTADGKGGTADTVAYARHRGKRIVVVWP